MPKITVIPGDGIGPEIVAEAVKVLRAIGTRCNHIFEIEMALAGGAAIDFCGEPLPQETIALCQASDAVLLGAVGGPQWDHMLPKLRPEQAILGLRKELGLFGNLRPVKLFPALRDSSPLRLEILESGIDLLIVRELTGGIYFGPRQRNTEAGQEIASDLEVYSASEIERIMHMAFTLAAGRRNKVISVDKANVLESSRLWREIAIRVASHYPQVELEHMYVDNCAMQLILNPGQFDVVVTSNMFGDILSDEASVLTGSIGMLPSASLRGDSFGLYEPSHGSAPDIAGQGKANPLATILSVALMLRSSLGLHREAAIVERAVEHVLESGKRTADIGKGTGRIVNTVQMGDCVAETVLTI